MPTETKVWEIKDGKIMSRDNAVFADTHKEDELEGWISANPDMLGEKLLIISRQLVIPEVGRLDLLGMDSNGKLVIVELKRNMLPREAVAQALDYASWLSNTPEEEIAGYANQYLQSQSGDMEQSLADAFEEAFDTKLPDWVCQNHRIVLVAAGLDASAERIVSYLAQRHSVDINAHFFNYCELSDGKQILVRSVLVPASATSTAIGKNKWMTEAALLDMSKQNKTIHIVEICREMNEVWAELFSKTAEGSFKYAIGRRDGPRVYGVNVSGKLAECPIGKLDIWVRTAKLAEVTGIGEEAIKQRLSKISAPFIKRRMDFILRLNSTKDAELLIAELKGLAKKPIKSSATVA